MCKIGYNINISKQCTFGKYSCLHNGGVQGVTEAYSGTQGMCPGADRGSQGVQEMRQWLAGDYRVYMESVLGLKGTAQGMTGKKLGWQENMGWFSYGQWFSDHVVYTKNSAPVVLHLHQIFCLKKIDTKAYTSEKKLDTICMDFKLF